MFRVTEDPSSGSLVQCWAKILNKRYNKFDVCLTVHRDSVWIRKTN